MQDISTENVFHLFLFLVFLFFTINLLWKKCIFLYTQGQLTRIKIKIFQIGLEHNDAVWNKSVAELIEHIEMVNNNLKSFSLSSYFNFKKSITEKDLNILKKQEKKRLSKYPEEIQKMIIEIENEICMSIIFYMLHKNLFLMILSSFVAIYILISVIIEFFKHNLSKQKEYKKYNEAYQELTDKHIPNDSVTNFLRTKAA